MIQQAEQRYLHKVYPRLLETTRQWAENVRNTRPVTVVRQLWPYLKPERLRLVDATLTTLVLTAVEVATPILIGLFVDIILALQTGSSASSWAQMRIIAVLAIGVGLRGYLISRQQALAGKIGERVAARMRNHLWEHVQRVPLDYIRRRGPGRISLRFISDTRMIQRLVTQGMVRFSQDVLLVIAVTIVLLVLNWRMALGILLIAPIYTLIFHQLNPQLRKASRATRRRRSRLSAYLHDRLTGMVAIKASVRQPVENERVRVLTRSLANRGMRRAAIGGKIQGFAAATVAGSGVVVLILATNEAAAGRLSGGMFVTFYTLLGLLVPIFQRFAIVNRTFQEASISVERFVHTLSVQPEALPSDKHPPLQICDGNVSVERVSYKHPGGAYALRHVSFQAQRGELIALVGPNGAGKSSLINLLLGFCRPTRGRIMIDGQDITEASLESLRSQIGLVSQDAPLFDGTVAQNIAYGVQHGVPEAQIERAARLTGVDHLVAKLPDGWNTQVGAGGQALSGGQRQQIALARALAADPPILVLDEATSALDAEAEHVLAETLRTLADHKTVIVSAHRLATLLIANRIYVLEQGQLVEVGTHTTLLNQGGVYARLFREERLTT